MRSIINLLFLFVMAAGCKKEEALTPSPEKENEYGDHTLPQGNHAYDADILQLFQKYNTLFLYKYVPHDLYYQRIEYKGGTYDAAKDSTTWYGYFDVPSNEAWIGQQLNLLKDIWLKFYPDAVLNAMLPKKVFLLDSVFYAYQGKGTPADNLYEAYDYYQGEDFFAVTWGSERIAAISASEKYHYKSVLNTLFLTTARQKGFIRRSTSFTSLSNYPAVTFSNHYALGVLDYYSRTPDADWDMYVQTIVSNSYEQLTAPGGVLHPDTDTKGLIRKKYDIMIAYFQDAFGVDLQAIGNAGL